MAGLQYKPVQTEFLDPADFKLVCRVCLKSSQVQLQSIFSYKVSSERFPQNLTDKIKICSGVSIEIGDGFPGKICGKCFQLLTAAYSFRTMVENSYDILKRSLRKTKGFNSKKHLENKGVIAFTKGNHESSDKWMPELREKSGYVDEIKHEVTDTRDNAQNFDDTDDDRVKSNEEGFDSDRDGLVRTTMKKCSSCRLEFRSTTTLKRHRVEEHAYDDDNGFYCYGCDEVYSSEAEREAHEESHCKNMPAGTKYVCRLCPGILDTRKEFNTHLDGHKTKQSADSNNVKVDQMPKVMACHECSFSSDHTEQWHAHRLRHRGLRPYACPSCPFRTDIKGSLVTHVRRHSDARPYPCPQCSYRTKLPSSLTLHMKGHCDWDKCATCHEDFPNLQTLLDHVTAEHGGLKFYSCTTCGNCYTSTTGLNRHADKCRESDSDDGEGDKLDFADVDDDTLQDDEDEKPLTEIKIERIKEEQRELKCARQEGGEENGDEHYGTARNVFQCPACPFRTQFPKNYRIHKKTHLSTGGAGEHKCLMCEADFCDQRDLHEHTTAVHERADNYPCFKCGTFFKWRSGLMRHAKGCHAKHGRMGKDEDPTDPLSTELAENSAIEVKDEAAKLKHECRKCGVTFDKKCALDQHERRHVSPGVFACPHCPRRSLTLELARAHRATHSNLYSCAHCHYQTRFPASLEKHARRHAGRKQVKCSMCDKSYLSKDGLRYHVATTHKEQRRYPCKKCGKVYLSTSGRHYHTAICKAKSPDDRVKKTSSLTRSTRGKESVSSKNVQSEESSLPKSKELVPRVGRVKDSSAPRPPKRKKARPGPQKFMCEMCGLVLGTPSAHRQHMARHAGKYRWYTCERCPFKTRHSEMIRAHRLRHDGLKPFACQKCPYRTDLKSSLAKHEMAHAGDLRHACKLCPFRSVNTGNLKRHMTKHTQEKPHQCSLCDKAYVDKLSLKDHVAAVHEGLKPYACAICGGSYTRRRGLLKHTKRLHPETLKCSMCDKTYTNKKSLGDHIASVHEGLKRYACKVCGACYTRNGGLGKHVKKCHPEVPRRAERPPLRLTDQSFINTSSLVQ